jgi:hypothetical protein
MKPPLRQGSSNDFQTPIEAIEPLLPFLKRGWVIWECACGKGNIVNYLNSKGFLTVGTDLLTGHDFMMYEPTRYDCIITNPPYKYKQDFLERAYLLNKPFAFLLPLTTFETKKRQQLFKKHGLEVIFLPHRVNFETPSGKGSGSWFATAWFTNGFNIGKGMIFL